MAVNTTTEQQRSWMETPPQSPAIKHLSGEFVARMPWLDSVSKPVQSWIAKLYGEPRGASYRVKDMLNGTWFGHLLHPPLVTIPLGAWTATLLLDLAWVNEQDEGTARSADMTLWLGLAGALASAVTGATQWVDTDGAEQRTGMFHALLNIGVTGLNTVSAILRLTGQRHAAISLSTTAYAVSLYSAYLGGELSFSDAIGVNHVAW